MKWLVFGEMHIGDVEAKTKAEAEQRAAAIYYAWDITRVQSRASWEVSQQERRVQQARPDPA